MIPSVAKEAGNSISVGDNSTYSNGGNRKNKCSSEKSEVGTRNRVAKKGFICYGHR